MSQPQLGQTTEMDPMRALAVVAGYPDQIIRPPLERTDSLVEIAYEISLKKFRQEVRGESDRQELVRGMGNLLTAYGSQEAPAGLPHLQLAEVRLMLEALERTFPHALETDDEPATEEMTNASAKEFRGVIDGLMARAARLDWNSVHSTNNRQRALTVAKEDDGKLTELCLSLRDKEESWRRTTRVCRSNNIYMVQERYDHTFDHRWYGDTREVSCTPGQEFAGMVQRHNRPKEKLDPYRAMCVANHMLKSVRDELSRRATPFTL